ncbi:MAG: hypothetical protein WD031_04265, partial [Gemmatimonadota bacterium]
GAVPACDNIPTELPKWNTTWVIPSGTTDFSVGEFLPGGIAVSEGGSEFLLSLDPVTFSRSIGELCGPCSAADGFVVPKPAFTADFDADVALPGEILSVEIAGGELMVELEHDFSFDPINPSASADGYLVITATRGSTLLAKDSINGATSELPPNTPVLRQLSLGAGAVDGPITVGVRLHSPAGDPVLLDSDQRLTVSASANDVRVTETTVRITDQSVSAEEVELPLEDLDTEISDRVKSGALRMEIDNPFDVSGSLQVRISAPGAAAIVKTLQIPAGVSSQRVEFSGSELRSILGEPGVTMNVEGGVSSPTAGTAVRPNHAITIDGQLELTVGPKEN